MDVLEDGHIWTCSKMVTSTVYVRSCLIRAQVGVLVE